IHIGGRRAWGDGGVPGIGAVGNSSHPALFATHRGKEGRGGALVVVLGQNPAGRADRVGDADFVHDPFEKERGAFTPDIPAGTRGDVVVSRSRTIRNICTIQVDGPSALNQRL